MDIKNLKTNQQSIYKLNNLNNISNLRIVSMLPGDWNGLPDDFYIKNYFRGVF